MITITGTVGAPTKYLVTGMPVSTTANAVLKMAFENLTAGTNLQLVAGTSAEFAAGTFSLALADSGGPGFQFLTIVDTNQLAGKIIYVLRRAGAAAAQFTLSVE